MRCGSTLGVAPENRSLARGCATLTPRCEGGVIITIIITIIIIIIIVILLLLIIIISGVGGDPSPRWRGGGGGEPGSAGWSGGTGSSAARLLGCTVVSLLGTPRLSSALLGTSRHVSARLGNSRRVRTASRRLLAHAAFWLRCRLITPSMSFVPPRVA